MKKKNLFGLNLFIILIAVIFAVVLIIGNVRTVRSSVAVEEDSYAKQYAEEKHLNMVALSDSEKVYFDQRYETFEFNTEGNLITLESYNGSSTDLVIPMTIANKKVIALSENFMSSLSSVKNLYISSAVERIEGDPVTNINIYCSDDNEFYTENKEKGWNFVTVYDSTFVNYNLGDLPYEFNVKDNNIEITKYVGNDKMLIVIPSYINGMPVTDISMNLLGTAEVIVIPSTVTSITGISSKAIYSPIFAIELVFTILAFLISLILINVFLPRYKKNRMEEYLLTGNQIIAVILYVLVQTGFCIYTIYFASISSYLALIISLVILIVFVSIVMMAGCGREHVKEVTARNVEKTARMKSIKLSAKGLSEGIEDADLKKYLQRVEEEIRFSDSVTSSALDEIESDIEKAISDLKKSIQDNKPEEIKMKADELMNMVQERNYRCKEGK
jgi:hypothetical protein